MVEKYTPIYLCEKCGSLVVVERKTFYRFYRMFGDTEMEVDEIFDSKDVYCYCCGSENLTIVWMKFDKKDLEELRDALFSEDVEKVKKVSRYILLRKIVEGEVEREYVDMIVKIIENAHV